jgi:4-hydroxybenzoate polyprenyltransferase
MRFLHFILAHSIFIAFCAVGLCYQTYILFNIKLDVNILAFVFFSTLCSYNFYWLLSKFYFSKRVLNIGFAKTHASFFLIFLVAAVGTIYFLFCLQNSFVFIAIGIVLTLLYALPLWPFGFAKKLQQLGLVKTVLLAFTWAYVTTVLPANFLLHSNMVAVSLLLVVRFSFMLLLCVVFDMRDITIDKLHGLHSLATDFSKKTVRNIIGISYIIFMLAALIFCFQFSNKLQATAFLFSGIIFWLLYRLSLKPKGYVFYYFLLDGLMLLSAAATCIVGFA